MELEIPTEKSATSTGREGTGVSGQRTPPGSRRHRHGGRRVYQSWSGIEEESYCSKSRQFLLELGGIGLVFNRMYDRISRSLSRRWT